MGTVNFAPTVLSHPWLQRTAIETMVKMSAMRQDESLNTLFGQSKCFVATCYRRDRHSRAAINHLRFGFQVLLLAIGLVQPLHASVSYTTNLTRVAQNVYEGWSGSSIITTVGCNADVSSTASVVRIDVNFGDIVGQVLFSNGMKLQCHRLLWPTHESWRAFV